jgi:hypothetical protein
MLPELARELPAYSNDLWEYSSNSDPCSYEEIYRLLEKHELTGDRTQVGEEILR